MPLYSELVAPINKDPYYYKNNIIIIGIIYGALVMGQALF